MASDPGKFAIRGRIVGLFEAGLGIRQIARRMRLSPSTVTRWINRHENGEPLVDKPKSGRPRRTDKPRSVRPRCTTVPKDLEMVNAMIINRMSKLETAEISQEIKEKQDKGEDGQLNTEIKEEQDEGEDGQLNIEIKEEHDESEDGQLNTEIKEEQDESEDGQLNTEIKQEVPEDCIENGTEENIDDLGKFYEVTCRGVPDESPMEEVVPMNILQVPVENVMEEDVQVNVNILQAPVESAMVEDVIANINIRQVPDESAIEKSVPRNSLQRCPHNKEIQQLETRVGRLESLLEVLVSKVLLSPPPKPVTPASASSSSSSVPPVKKITRINGEHLNSSLPHEAKGIILPTDKERNSAQKPTLQTVGAQPISAKGGLKTGIENVHGMNAKQPNSEILKISLKKGERLEIHKTVERSVQKELKPVPFTSETTVQVPDSIKFVPRVAAKPRVASPKSLSPKKPGFVFDESIPVDVDEIKSDLEYAAQVGCPSRVNDLLNHQKISVAQIAKALLVASTPDVVYALCQYCPKVVHEVDASRALFFAAEGGRIEILRALLSSGANPNACNRNSLTVLHKAASKGHAECVKALLQKGARVSATTNCRWTALHMAAISGSTSCITALLEYGVSVDEPDNMGCTALHYAARGDHHEVIRVLLDKGANPKFRNLQGKSPISFARSETVTEMLTATEEKETAKRSNESQPESSKKLKKTQQSSNDKLSSVNSPKCTVSNSNRKQEARKPEGRITRSRTSS